MATTTTTESAGAVDAGIVENMLASLAAQQDGVAFGALLDDRPQAATAVGAEHLPAPTVAELSYVISGNDAAIGARPAELAPVPPPPGLTARGWSAEVTARHPELVAATMAELVAAPAAAATDPFDPTDPMALAAAQRELGFAEVRMNNLRVRAIQLNNDRLSEAYAALVNGSPAAQAAYASAVEEAQAAAEGATAAAAPAPTPTTTTKTSSTTASTSTSGS